MKARLDAFWGNKDEEIIVSNEEAQCSYGQPVAIIQGKIYGSGDIIPGTPPLEWLEVKAGRWVADRLRDMQKAREDGPTPCYVPSHLSEEDVPRYEQAWAEAQERRKQPHLSDEEIALIQRFVSL